MTMGDSAWVQRRRKLVEDVVQGRVLVAAAKENKALARDTLLAMRDEIKDLRDEKDAWEIEKEALVAENARLEELLNPTQ